MARDRGDEGSGSSSGLWTPDGLILGSQVPTHKLVSPYDYSLGHDAVELAAIAGLELDPYQGDLLVDGMGVTRRPSQLLGDEGRVVERWSAFEVFIELSRQNGKSVVFEARVLAGLFLLRERLIVYSAHKGETALGAFARIEELIRNDPELLAEVKGGERGFRRTNGKEAIVLSTGQVVKFRTRTSGGGRGLSGDCVIIDEVQHCHDDHIAALFPTMSARPNPQIWYGGSAGGQDATVEGRLVRRMERESIRLTGYRFALEETADASDPVNWALVNPAVGRRMTIDFIAAEHDALSPEDFGKERLGQGDYPVESGAEWVIPRPAWEAAQDPSSRPTSPVVFVPEVKWDRTRTSISVAGYRDDGRIHVEVIAERPGTKWAVAALAKLVKAQPNFGVAVDPASPAKTLIAGLLDEGVSHVDPETGRRSPGPYLLTLADISVGFGDFYDGLTAAEPTILHRGGTLLTSSLAGAQTRVVQGAETWKRATAANVSSVLGVTWAARALKVLGKPKPPPGLPAKATRRADEDQRRAGGGDLSRVGF